MKVITTLKTLGMSQVQRSRSQQHFPNGHNDEGMPIDRLQSTFVWICLPFVPLIPLPPGNEMDMRAS